MGYIGNRPADSYTSFAVQHFTTSATTTYTLDNPVANENEIALFINNVRQEPGSSYAYTASGTTLTLSAATSASDTMYCVFIGKAVQTVTPANGSVTGDMMSYPLTNFSSTGIDDNATSTAVTIDSSGQMGVGETSPSAQLHVNDDIHDGITAKFVNSNAGNSGAEVYLIKDSSSPASGDNIGAVKFKANDDGGTERTFASIQAVTEDASVSSSDVSLRFYIRGNGSTNELIRLTSSGLHLGGTGSANALDDYEEGSFTPSLDIETGSNITVNTIQGYYRKIGNLVAFTIFCDWDKTAGSANMKFTGLPFTCSNQTNLTRQAVEWQQGAYTDQGAFFGGAVFGSSTDVYFVDSKYGSFNTNFDTNNAGRIANTTGIRSFVNGTYFTT